MDYGLAGIRKGEANGVMDSAIDIIKVICNRRQDHGIIPILWRLLGGAHKWLVLGIHLPVEKSHDIPPCIPPCILDEREAFYTSIHIPV
jgi:hypothetical protein